MKVVLVVALVLLIYVQGFHFGRKIVRLTGEGKLEELEAVRKRIRVVSAVNLVLMVAILVLAVFLPDTSPKVAEETKFLPRT